MRAADVVATRLYEAGCRWAFGMPGGEVLTLMDALTKAGITFVLCKHENAAGFMAEGTYHRTGAPGILLATVGPGLMNGLNVVENARQDRVPLIVLSGAMDADISAQFTHQVLDQNAVLAPMTKASFTLSAAAAHVIVDKSVAIATQGRPGPVHIDVPIAVADAPAKGQGILRRPASPVVPAPQVAAQVSHALSQAKRPLIVAGLDALSLESAAAIRQIAERVSAPVITTYKAKGVIPEDHPLSMGAAGLSPKADAILLPLVARADVILAVGYDPIEMRIGWQNPWDPEAQMVIDIAAEPNTHYMHQATINLIADPAASLQAIMPDAYTDGWPEDEVAQARQALVAAFAPSPEWGPGRAIAICREVLPEDCLATADAGAHRILFSQMWQCSFPRALTQSTGLCTMGCAVPLAMGAQIAERERIVVSFSGDAGFLMVAGELATAAEQNLRTIFVVFVDASLSLIALKQTQRQMSNVGVDFDRADIAAIGRAMGGNGYSVNSAESLREALHEAMAAPCFSVIAVEIDREAYNGTF